MMVFDKDDIPQGPRRRFYTCYSEFPSELNPKERIKIGESEYKKGLERYTKEGFIGALSYFEKSAEYEYPPAYVKLYCAYSKKYVDCILQEGKARYYEEKSVQNDTWFQQLEHSAKDSNDHYILASYHEHILKNTVDALKWYHKAAKRRQPNAQTDLAECYFRSDQLTEALYWWEQAAELGHAMAQLNLALWYSSSHKLLAADWCDKSGKNGFILARQLSAYWHLSGLIQKSEEEDNWDGWVGGIYSNWRKFDIENTFQNLSMLSFMSHWGKDRSAEAYWERKLGNMPIIIAAFMFVLALLLFCIKCIRF